MYVEQLNLTSLDSEMLCVMKSIQMKHMIIQKPDLSLRMVCRFLHQQAYIDIAIADWKHSVALTTCLDDMDHCHNL